MNCKVAKWEEGAVTIAQSTPPWLTLSVSTVKLCYFQRNGLLIAIAQTTRTTYKTLRLSVSSRDSSAPPTSNLRPALLNAKSTL